ncbi:MAG: hypothetical protein F4X87_00135 [Chloroflexi bacterium]|nr:hypothetical protein [Chloroflexota bacterium]
MSDFSPPDGAWPILLTGFDEHDNLDLPAVGALLDFYDGQGIPGLLALGQASEMLLLNDDERFRVAEYVTDHPRHNLTIALVGNFGATLPEQARSLGRIFDLGADLVVVALALLPSAQDLGGQLIELTRLVAPAVRLGIYEIPEPEHRLLSAEEVGVVAATDRYYFMKETSRDPAAFAAKVKAAAGTNLKIFQANLGALPPTMKLGASGFCGWMPIVAPELCAQVCDMSLPAELRQLAHDKLVAFNDVMVAHGFPASAKHILSLRSLPIQPYSRASAARRFFEIDASALDRHIAREQPFAPVAMPAQP